ncbi:MAG: hypothetical protein AB8B65_01300 [Kordia sp.]|uniref:hypothetical protein n=1 Tax=Kordia sp. TaxID=1965332 RepID=UPI003858661A
MQGKKIYQEKLFNNFQLSDRIPTENFHRRLSSELDLDYLYKPIGYNLKKYLKFITKTAKSGARSLALVIFKIKSLFGNNSLILSDTNFKFQ